MKIFKWVGNNILFLITLFLLIFIPLYPKLPVLDIMHTWVYIRAEDFIVTLVLFLWIFLILTKKITLKTPLTLPIMLFWIIGLISTIHGILLIFPKLDNVFPNVAFLSYLRRIEYVSLFFISYSGIKDKRSIPYITIVLAITLILVAVYGIGQKFFGFPAYLTMNEEFAKGIPIRLSSLSRVSSTFGGHYDLAAYLVLIIPLIASMIFGFKNWFIKFFLFISACLGFVVLFMTVSRISFFVLFLSLIAMLFFHKKRLAIIAVISSLLMIFLFLNFSTSLTQRFGNTVKKIDVLVDTEKGEAIGNVKEVPVEYFKNKVIKLRFAQNKSEINAVLGQKEDPILATNSALIIPYSQLPRSVPLVVEQNSPTGENLPQGTGYINLTLAPITKKLDQFFYQKSNDKGGNESDVIAIRGNFLVKSVTAYDLSFTTRFQGEWPKAIELFKRNIIFGGGYSSIGLAVDNNYFRILGEVGLLGFISYFGILLLVLIYIKKLLPEVDSPVIKSFVYGFAAGGLGLALNAIFIDVFEASKVAFVFWLLIGVTIGTLHLYQKKDIDLFAEFKRAITSTYAVIIYLFIAVAIVFSSVPNYYFVGDDFTWLRWVADCKGCSILDYFTNSNGFFYRPGTKIYFFLMYSGFWLNQTAYHIVSIFLHFVVAMLLFLIAKKILKNFFLSALAAFLFIIMSNYSEAVFWISSTGFLFTAVFVLIGLFFFILFEEKKKNIYFVISVAAVILGLLFHELGIIAPFLIILYGFMIENKFTLRGLTKKLHFLILFFPILPYLLLRYLAHSHWFNGDYSYNLFKLPFNIVGNITGYIMLGLLGPASIPFYQQLRNSSKENVFPVLIISIILVILAATIYRIFVKKMEKEGRRIVIFGSLFFVISLLPFLGLGNITYRYSYLSTIGFILIFVFFIKVFYNYIKSISSREISIASMIIIIGIFSLVHLIQLQKTQRDWNDAGEKVKNFITSLNGYYEDSWTKEEMHFYFVNVPIRLGEAWELPVGLEDAVWFVSRNDKIKVYQLQSVDEALSLIQNPETDRIFVFEDNGDLIKEQIPPRYITPPVKK
ncbi:MAG: O-antigen ligase family protein [Candidatus Levybacteria bacterium]|nr:O-antigen ligase family protein [Candidatus Levybacteria bacterium]